MARYLYHLALVADWEAALAEGAYRVSTLARTLEEEGFIHASFAAQVDGVATRFYGDVDDDLVLLTIDLTKVEAEVRLEVPPGADDAFPHLYGPIDPTAVVDARPYVVPKTPPARLHHAHIFASDMDATISFYERFFGARVVSDEVLLGSRNVMVGLGDGRLNIYDQAPTNPTRSGGIHHLGIQVKDLPTLVERLKEGGVEMRKPIVEGEGFRYVMVAAPDDVLLELFEAQSASMPPSATTWFAWQ